MAELSYDDEQVEILREMAAAIAEILDKRVRLEPMDRHLLSMELAQAAFDVAKPRLATHFAEPS